jgi:hypothetical protein
MKRADLGWAGLFGGASVAAALNLLTQNDLFWHLGLGQAAIEARSRSVREPWSLLAPDAERLVPEWLWDIAVYAVHTRWGMEGVHVFVLFWALLLGVTVVWLMRDIADEYGVTCAQLAPAAALGVAAANARINERPETAAVALLPVALVLARRFAHGRPASRTRAAVCLVALELLWAQLHGTFVLVPAVALIACTDPVLRALRARLRAGSGTASGRRLASPGEAATAAAIPWRLWALTGAGLALGALTSAYGFDVHGYLLAHLRGDAVRHIIDMQAPSWAAIDPSVRPYFAFYFALLVAAGCLLSVGRRCRVSSLLFAVLGLGLVLTAIRSVGLAALLMLPFCMEASATIFGAETRVRRLAFTALAVLVLMVDLDLNDGKEASRSGRLGFDYDRIPLAAAKFFAAQPRPARVFATFAAAAPLGYLAHGKAQVWMDSRTPLHFDDTDYALLRDAGATPPALRAAVDWFGLTAAVARNDLNDCATLARSERFAPVLLEWSHTTFVRRDQLRGAQALETLAPCAQGERVRLDRCSAEYDAAFERDLRRTGWAGQAFVGMLRAERALRCGLRQAQVAALPKWLEARRPASELRAEQRLLLGEAFAAVGEHERALALLGPLALAGNGRALGDIGAAADRLEPSAARALLEPLDEQYGSALPLGLRLLLARACMREGEVECAYFHALRASLAAPAAAAPALRWLSEQPLRPEARLLLQRALNASR